MEPVRVVVAAQRALGAAEGKAQADLLRCIFGNPFRAVSVEPSWRTSTVILLAEGIYAERDFGRMPILGMHCKTRGATNLPSSLTVVVRDRMCEAVG